MLRVNPKRQISWRKPRMAGLLFLLTLLTGCNMNGVEVKAVAVTAEKPSNVAAYVAVSDGGGAVEDLENSNFKVYENGQPIPRDQARLTLLPREHAVLHHTLLLVDMSGARGKNAGSSLARAVAGFVQKVRQTQRVTVYVFDGRPTLELIGDYDQQSTPAEPDLAALASFVPRDPSRDLGSAITEGIKQLDARLMQAKKPIRVGVLVVFTQGADLAGRIGEEHLAATLDATRHETYAIVTPVDDMAFLPHIQRHGVVNADSHESVPIAFEEMAIKLRTAYDKYYLVSYCSPARAGKRRLRLEVVYNNLEGEQRSGSFEYDFDANGFGAGCDPNAVPSFAVVGGLQLEPPPQPDLPARENPRQ